MSIRESAYNAEIAQKAKPGDLEATDLLNMRFISYSTNKKPYEIAFCAIKT
jgi:hypothetical protein